MKIKIGIIALILIMLFASSSFAIYKPATITKTITSSVAAVAILTTGDVSKLPYKVIAVKNSTGGTTTSFEVYASTNEASWYTLDVTTFGSITAGSSKVLSLTGYPIEYFKVSGILTGNGISTPEVVFRGN